MLVVAQSSADPDLACFLPVDRGELSLDRGELSLGHGGLRLGACFLVARVGQAPRLGYLTPMEREEAAITGLEPLDPGTLGVTRLRKQAGDGAGFLAGVLQAGLAAAGVEPSDVALAGTWRAGTLAGAVSILEEAGWRLRPGNELVLRVRKRKTAAQLAAARRTAGVVATALRRVAGLLAAARVRDGELWLEGERLRAGRLRTEVARTFAAAGLTQPEGNIVAAGAAAGVPHTRGSSERVLVPGEALVVDLFPQGGLFADCTRTFCVGPAPPALAAAHEAVRRALAEAHGAVAPGRRGWDLQLAICRRFEDGGYPTALSAPDTVRGYVHGLGHGVGFELHEYPSFREAAGEEGTLEEGDLLTLEPGLYDPAAGWGVRLEDLVALGPDGPENLTPLPCELDPAAWA